MGSGTKFEATINHETFLTQSAMRGNQNVVQARRELHPFPGRQLTFGEVGCAIAHTQVLQVFLQGLKYPCRRQTFGRYLERVR